MRDQPEALLGRDLQLVRRRFAATSVDGNFVGDLLAFCEAEQPRALNRADVDEDVWAAQLRLNEAKPFLTVEPFYCAGLHDMSFQEQADCALPIAKRLWIEVLERKSGADARRESESKIVRPNFDNV